jgi:sec-independent protein translocase protein TatB
MSFGELMMLLLVAVVVLGPKELPKYLRKAGQFAGRIRRMAYEMREKSGIDEVLRTEGIDRDLAEIRRLARGELGGVVTAVRSVGDAVRPGLAPLGVRPDSASTATPGAPSSPANGAAPQQPPPPPVDAYVATQVPASVVVDRAHEYPRDGADAYGALPDTALVYDGNLPPSPLADDALYTRGEAA